MNKIECLQTLLPMEKAAVEHGHLGTRRVYSTSDMFTVTGRITMHEPSTQMVPRSFDVQIECKAQKSAFGELGCQVVAESLEGTNNSMDFSSLLLVSAGSPNSEKRPSGGNCYKVSLRRAFVASEGCVLLSADYSQLELRILAHLSGDPDLCRLLRRPDGDVFRLLAAAWLGKASPTDVSDAERQTTKQICYGMVYGMGVRTLSQELGLPEEEAAQFMAAFMDTYPGVGRFLESVKAGCRRTGYVQTMGGRRRFLPNIGRDPEDGTADFRADAAPKTNSSEAMKAAAERQAVNTTVQGSAADLLKSAMTAVAQSLETTFGLPRPPLRVKVTNGTRPLVSRGAYLLLQLHDELILDVCSRDVGQVAEIVRRGMEQAVKLKVPTPVNVKVGPNWNDMQPYVWQ